MADLAAAIRIAVSGLISPSSSANAKGGDRLNHLRPLNTDVPTGRGTLSFSGPAQNRPIYLGGKMKSEKLTCITAMALLVVLAIPVSLAAQEHHTKHHQYNLIDIGTFGGPNSGAFPGERLVNGRGVVTGSADTSIPDPFYPNCFGDCFVTHTFQWKNGE
jgi:hypothetical protein